MSVCTNVCKLAQNRKGGRRDLRETPAIAVEHGHDVEEDGVLRHPSPPADDVGQTVQVGAAVVRDHALTEKKRDVSKVCAWT